MKVNLKTQELFFFPFGGGNLQIPWHLWGIPVPNSVESPSSYEPKIHFPLNFWWRNGCSFTVLCIPSTFWLVRFVSQEGEVFFSLDDNDECRIQKVENQKTGQWRKNRWRKKGVKPSKNTMPCNQRQMSFLNLPAPVQYALSFPMLLLPSCIIITLVHT